MFQDFLEACRPGEDDEVLDVGVTPDTSLPESNFFEQLYPYRERIVATSIEDAHNIEQSYPGVTFVRTVGVRLPFEDAQFDIVFCSAVLEHVGSNDSQAEFVRELLRVGKRLYLTTPNRWFPVDFHTLVPFLHWLPEKPRQFILRRLGLDFWAQTDNLNLLGRRTLVSVFPSDVDVQVRTLRFLGWPSNLLAIARP